MTNAAAGAASEVDSAYAWRRLGISVLISTIGGVGMWSFVVALPTVQADFGVLRAEASLAYTLLMAGFAAGSVAAGKFADSYGIRPTLTLGGASIGLGYVAASFAPSLLLYAAAHFLIGLGTASSFGPLIADITQWFERRRGIAVGICSSGNYLAGALWPLILQPLIAADGWRNVHLGVGIFCLVTLLPLALLLGRRRREQSQTTLAGTSSAFGISPLTLQILLAIAGVACCVAMAMPQVHIVAYCNDLGYGVARGADMLTLMAAFGIVSRIGSGFIADRVGGLWTLLLGSSMQAVALLLYMMFDGLTSLYVVSALFGLFQGGIVPSYAIIVREYFPPSEAGVRLGVILMATLFGMAFGGWISGLVFDLTGSYRAAFFNGLVWNALNVTIAVWLLSRLGRRMTATA